jgi:hypothetical protein
LDLVLLRCRELRGVQVRRNAEAEEGDATA